MERAHADTPSNAQGALPGEDDLVAALWARNIRVFSPTRSSRSLSDEELVRGLVTSSQARFQLAIIPLLLGYPSCDVAVKRVVVTLAFSQRATLVYFYQAATYLQFLERSQRDRELPLRDFFSAELALPAADLLEDQPAQLEEALHHTARLQAKTTGLDLNWVEAYKKAARFVLRETDHAPSQHRAQRHP